MFELCDSHRLCALYVRESVSSCVSESSGSRVHTVSCPMGTGVLIPGVRHAEHKANHSPPLCVKVKNMWWHVSPSPSSFPLASAGHCLYD